MQETILDLLNKSDIEKRCIEEEGTVQYYINQLINVLLIEKQITEEVMKLQKDLEESIKQTEKEEKEMYKNKETFVKINNEKIALKEEMERSKIMLQLAFKRNQMLQNEKKRLKSLTQPKTNESNTKKWKSIRKEVKEIRKGLDELIQLEKEKKVKELKIVKFEELKEERKKEIEDLKKLKEKRLLENQIKEENDSQKSSSESEYTPNQQDSLKMTQPFGTSVLRQIEKNNVMEEEEIEKINKDNNQVNEEDAFFHSDQTASEEIEMDNEESESDSTTPTSNDSD
ncbi:hypothetical protein, conserved [Entamoeba dispar SAW760]|uniref:Uncharacterized protein n=1 Tax=Entamoeba dispar (strain ATCC PRA-260 / SAW760) TaxID=370354 RepID=B0E5Z7_ENTDS|nr:uncharacterized protein EDI_154010 [Entamoeba dispar SAW760]EDR30034.1 hypothetical protein, conserved [Entamoeba dispar SAW760]|eukprot:EDR30034.1 hypothetical protein, conserved [Entamoeba dispar SAW760]